MYRQTAKTQLVLRPFGIAEGRPLNDVCRFDEIIRRQSISHVEPSLLPENHPALLQQFGYQSDTIREIDLTMQFNERRTNAIKSYRKKEQ